MVRLYITKMYLGAYAPTAIHVASPLNGGSSKPDQVSVLTNLAQ